MPRRTGNAAVILLLVVAVGAGGALVTSPDTAEDMLPLSLLPLLPQFEQVDTDTSCSTIQSGTELVNELPLGGDVSQEEAYQFLCRSRCSADQTTIGGTCSDEEGATLTCICRTDQSE